MSYLRRRLAALRDNDDLDLYLLIALAVPMTVAGVMGVARPEWVYSAVLALIGLLAVSQLRVRRHLTELRAQASLDPLARLRSDYPSDLEARRNEAHDVLLIGIGLARTIQSYRRHLPSALARGARVRIVMMHPRHAESAFGTQDRVGSRIEDALADLAPLMNSGLLQVRLLRVPPSGAFNVLNVSTPSGVIVVQRREFGPVAESQPIFEFSQRDGYWYKHFQAEAERTWEAGTDWHPGDELGLDTATLRYTEEFGPELWRDVGSAREVLITGVSRNNMLTTHYSDFERLVQRGGRLRVLLVDPDSAAVTLAAERYYAEQSPDFLRARIEHSVEILRSLRKGASKGAVDIRFTEYPLSLGVLAASSDSATMCTALYAEYFTHRAPGAPKVRLTSSDTVAFETFMQEAEILWDASRVVPSS